MLHHLVVRGFILKLKIGNAEVVDMNLTEVGAASR